MMKGNATLACIVFLLICLSMPVALAQFPQPPCIFYGYVSVGGQPAPDGVNITAVISGTSLNWTTTTQYGTYGWQTKGSNTFMIPSANDSAPKKDGGATNDMIIFYVGGVQNVQTTFFESGGVMEFDLSVPEILEHPGSQLNSSLMMSVGCPALYSGYKVGINGTLTLNGTGISNANLTLAYIDVDGQSWSNIGIINTAADGSYYSEWTPPNSTGYYHLEVSWEGNNTVAGSQANACLGTTTPDGKYVFSVVSNSVVSNLAYNSTTRFLNFTAAGSSTTLGYANVTLAKDLTAGITGLKAYMDEDIAYYTASSTDTSWTLHLVYPQSTHNFAVDLGSSDTPFLKTPVGIITLSVVIVFALAMILVARRRLRKHPHVKPKNARVNTSNESKR